MQIEKLSQHGYKVIDALPPELFEQVYALAQTTDQFVLQDDGRWKIGLDDHLYERLQNYFQLALTSVDPNIQRLSGMEVWRDPPGYTNAYHTDDPSLRNIMIVYLETHDDPSLGTGYVETDGVEYKAQYAQNQAMIVLNSDKIVHGLVGRVPGDVTRLTLYINWK